MLLVGTASAVELRDVYSQYSNTSFDLNKTVQELDRIKPEAALEIKEASTLQMELEYLRKSLSSMENWYAADKTGSELQDKLHDIRLNLLEIELKSKLIRAKLLQQYLLSDISSANAKVEASNKLTSVADPLLQSTQTGLSEAKRLVSQASNITVDMPSYPGTVNLQSSIKAVDEKLYLLENGQKEIKSSLDQSDKILGRVQEQKVLLTIKMQEFSEKLFQVNATIEALKSEGVNTVFPESSMKQAQQIRSELDRLVSEENYEEALNRVPTGIALIQKASAQVEEAKEEHQKDKNRNIWAIGLFAVAMVVVAIVWVTRPPRT